MSVQIYFFSGTGNSLHVAMELEKRIPETTLIPIIHVLKSGDLETTAETVGIVFPIHAFNMPAPVKQFLQQVNLKSASYIFAIATRFCSDKVFLDMDKILTEQEKSLDACFAVELPCTYIPIFKIPPQEKIEEMESVLQKRLDEIETVVINKQINHEKDNILVFLLGHVLYPPITAWYQRWRFPDMARSFYVESHCNGCGLCERICLSERIKMDGKIPAWQEEINCLYCFACLHYCPVQAVQIAGRKTDVKDRYHHIKVNAAKIARQKE